jgi:serralysin
LARRWLTRSSGTLRPQANALSGGAGSDRLTGALGCDTLTGGVFDYDALAESASGAGNRDVITDFQKGIG